MQEQKQEQNQVQNQEQKQEQSQPQDGKYRPDNNLVWAVLCTLLCCLPLGIVAIIKAASVENLWYQGRYDEAMKAARDAKNLSIWGAVLATVGALLYIFLMGGIVFLNFIPC